MELLQCAFYSRYKSPLPNSIYIHVLYLLTLICLGRVQYSLTEFRSVPKLKVILYGWVPMISTTNDPISFNLPGWASIRPNQPCQPQNDSTHLFCIRS